MTHQGELIVTINKLIGKTREGKLSWEVPPGGGRCALVGEQHRVRFEFGVLVVNQEVQPRPGSLKLTLELLTGEPLAAITEDEMARVQGQVGVLALRQLFAVLVVAPHRGQIDTFRSALEEL